VTTTALLAFAAGALVAGLALAGWRRAGLRAAASREAERAAAVATRPGRVELLARHANDAMLLADERHQLVDVNERFCEQLGYSREEALRLNVGDLRDPSTLPDLPLRKRDQVEQGGGLFETRYRRKDGSIYPVEVSVRVAALDGQPHFHAIVRDITERRRMELQLQLADRMATVATLSAGVAHEINNPLAFVLGNVDYALSRLDHLPADLEEVRKALQDARGGADRVGQIVRDLRTFSRAGEAERTEVDVRRALQTAVTLAQTEIRQRAQLSLELGPVPPVLGNAHRIGQLLLNLLVNAAQAIPPGHPDRHLVQASTSLAPDGRVRIEITDTGAGIPAEVLPRIFDPFFTTRAIGQGLGLGLAIVHGIVTDLGGEVKVRSEPGGGSIFTVLLPPARRDATVPALTPAPEPPTPFPTPVPLAPPRLAMPRPTPTAVPATPSSPLGVATGPAPFTSERALGSDILVIDDEPLVGRAIVRMLSPPHRVVAVGSAAEGLAALAGGHFDTILCDLMMPEMTGMALHEKLLAEAPSQAARMVFLSGGAFTEEAAAFLDRVPNTRLEKPFSPGQLRAAVASAFGSTRG
jgi:PAS domain S-box-containing protein